MQWLRWTPPTPGTGHRQESPHRFPRHRPPTRPRMPNAATEQSPPHRRYPCLVARLHQHHTEMDLASPPQVQRRRRRTFPRERRGVAPDGSPSPHRALLQPRLCRFRRLGVHQRRWTRWRWRWRGAVCQRRRASQQRPSWNAGARGAAAVPASQPRRRWSYLAARFRRPQGDPW